MHASWFDNSVAFLLFALVAELLFSKYVMSLQIFLQSNPILKILLLWKSPNDQQHFVIKGRNSRIVAIFHPLVNWWKIRVLLCMTSAFKTGWQNFLLAVTGHLSQMQFKNKILRTERSEQHSFRTLSGQLCYRLDIRNFESLLFLLFCEINNSVPSIQ